MKFIQIMEFEGAPEDAENALQSYIEKAWEEAQKNNELEITNDDHEETQESFGEITFKNLDVFGEYEV